VVGEVGVDGWEDCRCWGYVADTAEEVDGRFQAAGEEAGSVDEHASVSAFLLHHFPVSISTVKRDITHPVKNRFPILAEEKSNLELGLMRFTIS